MPDTLKKSLSKIEDAYFMYSIILSCMEDCLNEVIKCGKLDIYNKYRTSAESLF